MDARGVHEHAAAGRGSGGAGGLPVRRGGVGRHLAPQHG